MPAMWEASTNEDFLRVIGAFRKSRSPVENLAAPLAELATLTPGEAAGFIWAALPDAKPADLGEILSVAARSDEGGRQLAFCLEQYGELRMLPFGLNAASPRLAVCHLRVTRAFA